MLQSGGKSSPEAVVAKVTVDAPDFSTAGTMFQDALKSLRAAPSLLWLDLPCKCSSFDRGDEATAATIWAAERRRENGMGNGIDGPTNGGHWTSVVEVWSEVYRCCGWGGERGRLKMFQAFFVSVYVGSSAVIVRSLSLFNLEAFVFVVLYRLTVPWLACTIPWRRGLFLWWSSREPSLK